MAREHETIYFAVVTAQTIITNCHNFALYKYWHDQL